MRILERLVDQSRRATENIEFSDTNGVTDEEFIQYANDGQDRIESLINSKRPDVFLAETSLSLESTVEAYTMPPELYMSSRIKQVELSRTGSSEEYFILPQRQFIDRVPTYRGTPAYWIRRNNQILLQPTPDRSGILRVTYLRKQPRMDFRRGAVKNCNIDSTNRLLLTMELDNSLTLPDQTPTDESSLNEENYFSVVDRDGSSKMNGVSFQSFNTSGNLEYRNLFCENTSTTTTIKISKHGLSVGEYIYFPADTLTVGLHSVVRKILTVPDLDSFTVEALPATPVIGTNQIISETDHFHIPHRFDAGESIAINDFVIRGANSSTHSQLPDMCERYLVSYMNWKILKRDSSVDSQEQERELSGLEKDIIESFGDADDAFDQIPIISDDDYRTDGWW